MGMAQLTAGLESRGMEYVPSVANFLLVEVGDGRAAYQVLLQRGVIVRPMAGYGLGAHVRVTVGTKEENDRFLEALDEWRSGSGS